MTLLRHQSTSSVALVGGTGRKSWPLGRVLITFTAALTLLSLALAAAAAQSQQQQPPEALFVSPLKIGSPRAKNVLPDFRCSKPMRSQPRFPTLNTTSRSTIDYGGQLKLSVPQALFTSDFDYISSRKQQKSAGVSPIVPVSLRPTLLSEFCAELPFLLRLGSTKDAIADAERVFKNANQGCSVLSAMFNARNQAYANPRPASTSTPPIDGPSNSFEVTLRSIKHIIATFKDNGSLIKEPTKGTKSPPSIAAMRELPMTMSPFADARAVDTFAVVEAVQKAVQEQVKQITKRDGGAEILKALAAVEAFAILGVGDAKLSQDIGKQGVVVFAKTLAKFATIIESTMVSQRNVRAKKNYPWSKSPAFNVTSVVQLNKVDGDNFAKIFSEAPAGHISFDVALFTNPIKSVVKDLLAPSNQIYSAGDVQKCKLVKPKIAVMINGKPWFSGSLVKNPGTPIEPQSGKNAVMYTVNWFLPANANATSVHPTRKALSAAVKSRDPVRMTFEVTASASEVGTVGCPNLPTLPVTISTAYACNDDFKTAQQKLASASQADAFEDDALDFSFTDESDASFEDDMWADYSVGDEGIWDDGMDEDGVEDSVDFALGDDLVWDENGLDEEADFALADAEAAADEMFSAGEEAFADDALFDEY
ncbi:hypothetical protein BCR44DRAFT_82100 [Catenaria anguillulae PL171]|uniref:Uncharacterized protein n=1 Tax=Catenaria anguillulae PL171 TaxID=765915 RepID=A0A1Y2HQB5_9FUNG|nr:hypothetical protein BCR44DRAFT_82100 [Catenaria anguillulae PL171]